MIFIGADHRGFIKKQELLNFFTEQNFEFSDLGAYVLAKNDDFNEPAIAVAKSVRKDPKSFGILICGSAHGMTIQANRFKGIRAITSTNPSLVRLGREHNNANILCLSADFLTLPQMQSLIKIFINTNFTPIPKYLRRINRLDEREDYA